MTNTSVTDIMVNAVYFFGGILTEYSGYLLFFSSQDSKVKWVCEPKTRKSAHFQGARFRLSGQ